MKQWARHFAISGNPTRHQVIVGNPIPELHIPQHVLTKSRVMRPIHEILLESLLRSVVHVHLHIAEALGSPPLVLGHDFRSGDTPRLVTASANLLALERGQSRKALH